MSLISFADISSSSSRELLAKVSFCHTLVMIQELTSTIAKDGAHVRSNLRSLRLDR